MSAAVAIRNFVVLYRTATDCPSCGRHNWIVGRTSAECASCGTALPLASVPPPAAETIQARRRRWLPW